MDENQISRSITQIIHKALDVLLLQGPKTTGYGILVGIIIQGLIAGFAPDPFFQRVPFHFYLAVGILILNLANWVVNRTIGPSIPESVQRQIALIKQMQEQGLPKEDVAKSYQKVLENYIKQESKLATKTKTTSK